MQDKLAANNQRMAEMQNRMFGNVAAGYGLYRALKAPISAAANFESIMYRVEDATKASTDQMSSLSKQARDLGRSTAFSAVQAGEAQEMLAKNGLAAEQILNGATVASLKLASATGSDLSGAADIATDTMASFGKKAEDLISINNDIVGTLKASKFQIDDYRLALGQAGGVAGTVGVEMEDFNAAIAATSYMFSSGSDAGTSFKTFLQSLPGNSDKAVGLIRQYGMEFHDAAGNLKDMDEIAQELQDGVGHLSEEMRTAVLKDIFGTDAMRTAAGLYRAGAEGIEEYRRKIAEGNAEESAAARMKGLNGAMRRFQSVMADLAISIGNALIPSLTKLTDFLAPLAARISEFADANPKLTQTIVALTAGLVGLRVAAFAAQFAFFWLRGAYLSTAIGGLKLLHGGLTGLAGAFGRLAPKANAAGAAMSRADQAAITARNNAAASKSMIASMSGTALANANASRAMITGMSTAATVAAGSITAVAAPVVAAGAAIAAAGYLVYRYWEPISEFFSGFASVVGQALSSAATAVGDFGMKIAEALGIEEFVQPALDAISQFGTMAADAFRGVVENVKSFLSSMFTQEDYGAEAEAEFRSVGERAASALIDQIMFVPRKVGEIFTGLSDMIAGKIEPIELLSKFSNPAAKIANWFVGLSAAIRGKITFINFLDKFGNPVRAIVGWFTGLSDLIRGRIGIIDFFDKFVNPVSKILSWFRGLGQKILGAIGKIDISNLVSMPSWLGGGGKRSNTNPASEFGGARAAGGAIAGGRTYLVGEEGPELVTPSRSGYVHDADETAGMMSSRRSTSSGAQAGGQASARGPITVHNRIEIRNAQNLNVDDLVQEIEARLRDQMERDMQTINADLN